MKKTVSFLLVIAMLTTCILAGIVSVGATTTILDGTVDYSKRSISSETAGKNIRFTGGTYGNVYAGGFNLNWSTSDDVVFTFDGGTFNNVNMFGRLDCVLSGNVIFNINGGTFNYVHDYGTDTDFFVDGAQKPEHAIMFGDIRGVRVNQGDNRPFNTNGDNKANHSFKNIALIIDGGSDNLVLTDVGVTGRVASKMEGGVWMAIVNNCTNETVPVLTGKTSNPVVRSESAKFVDVVNVPALDYRMYVKDGVATPVFDGTVFRGFKLEANNGKAIPKITYVDSNGKAATAYPTPASDGIFDLSAYKMTDLYDRVMIVEFVPEVEALGASLRFVADDAAYNGIRFGMRFLQNSVTDAGKESANFGLILISKAAYEAKGTWTLEELKASEKARVATGNVCIEDPATETYTVNAILYNIPEANYQSEIVAIPYIGDTLLTDAMITRSIYSVAEACVADASASQAARDYCQSILDSVTPQS